MANRKTYRKWRKSFTIFCISFAPPLCGTYFHHKRRKAKTSITFFWFSCLSLIEFLTTKIILKTFSDMFNVISLTTYNL